MTKDIAVPVIYTTEEQILTQHQNHIKTKKMVPTNLTKTGRWTVVLPVQDDSFQKSFNSLSTYLPNGVTQ